MKKNKISIYIHIPFCESRCYYCDFCSSLLNRENEEKYFHYLEREIKLRENILKERTIDTIFIGGGTPSSVNEKFIAKILNILKNYDISENAEITIESNPNSLTRRKAEIFFSSGINRISIGAQSFNDEILKKIGRIHKSDDIYKAVENARAAGFTNINLDLMLALPSQKFSDILKSIDEVKKLNLPHISYYSLILEEGTILYKAHKKTPLAFPNELEDRKMYHYVVTELEKIGLHQYEISNFAKRGFECRHNLIYWKLKDYISFGLNASSNIKSLRYRNFSDFKNYYNSIDKNNLPIEFSEKLSENDRINEYIMLGLRLNSGININEFNEKFQKDFLKVYESEIEKNITLGLINFSENKIYLTEKGRDLSNQVELDFFR
ncbi:MAG: radical SAM family heme chaperone HemW [Peptoniphilaceae bacterium]|nr:radical SAM family heme chaperone HemW [Peptoniphilaceae bacterium]